MAVDPLIPGPAAPPRAADAPELDEDLAPALDDADAVAFCRRVLPQTSRTFALNIPQLPPPLDDAVTVAYLLCRIADTLEDEAAGDTDRCVALLHELIALCELPEGWRARARRFTREARTVLHPEAPAAEIDLLEATPTVLTALATMPRAVRAHVATCVAELAGGMAKMLRRRHDRGNPLGLRDLDETLEYCHYVAGTVGEMLTRMFAWHAPAAAAKRGELFARADSFGHALQLTNILKDVRQDLDRGRCWLPRTVLTRHGIASPEQLADPARRAQAVAVLDEMLSVAHREVIRAFEYVMLLPREEPGLRLFCLWPLFMAVLTLRKLRGNAAVFDPAPVKISRNAVRATLASTRALVAQDGALRLMFATLTRGLPAPAAPDAPRATRAHTAEPTAAAADRARTAALDALVATQSPTGSWHGDYGGPLFLLPMYVGTCYALGEMPDEATRAGLLRYLTAHQNPDGGWGLDVEAHSHVFTSVLNYVALRLLGLPASDPRLERARAWFLPRGGAAASASWGKFFLAVMGLYAWEGLEPLLPELWLLPEALPLHPSRLWCHARMVYLPMSWLYGRRATVRDDALLASLRRELYAEPYEQIDWAQARTRVAESDAYTPLHAWMRAAHAVMRRYETRPSRALRERALATLLEHIDYEDRATHYLCIGPVNKVLNALVWHFERPGGDEVRAHVAKLPEYLYRAADGVKMQGYNSSELWDTAFAVQAMVAAGDTSRCRDALSRAAEFVEQNQIAEDPPELARFYRHQGRGGWPFSTREHGWPISDCTAEGLKAVFALDAVGLGDAVTPARRADAVELVLSWQNADGGWATYEKTRAPRWLEKLNPSDVFGDIMIDYSYVECTSACVQALRGYVARYPARATPQMREAIARGEEFLLRAQRPDGSWEGSWGVCFTYGTWFGVCGLAGSDDPRARGALDRACDFLAAHQMEDGGWGETVESCRLRRYVHAESGQAVMTSWALLALARAGRVDSPAVKRGVAFLLARQLPDGRWPDEHLAGVFNKTCAIHYDAYLKVFPLWALALCAPAAGGTTADAE